LKTSLSPLALIFGLFVVLYVVVFATQRLYPFIDLPNHLAEVAIYKWANTSVLGKFYSVDGGIHPSSLHYLFCNFFDDIETGNKFYYMLYVLALPCITCLIILKLGGNWRFAFLSLLLVFNYNAVYGFAGFTMAIPIVLLVFYLLCYDAKWANVILAGVLILLFLSHALCLLFSLFLIFVLAVWRSKTITDFLARVWFVVPVFVLFVVWQMYAFKSDHSTSAFLLDYYTNDFIPKFYLRSKIFFFDNFVLFAGVKGVVLAFLFSCVMLLPVFIKIVKQKVSVSAFWIFSKQHKESMAFLFVCFVCCFFLPGELPGQEVLYQRFSVFLFLSIIILGSILHANSVNKYFQSVALAAVFAHMVLWYDYMADFNRENENFNASFFADVPKEEPMASVMIDFNYRGRPVYMHFSNYHILWSKGVVTTMLIDYRFGSIKRVASKQVLPELKQWAGISRLIPEEYKNLKYLLLKGEPTNLPANTVTIAEQRDWKILKLN
jgi:hypothetical protein